MITISIVDDEKELCQSIATFVNGAEGFRCVSMYHSGEMALKHLPVDRPNVVLMDIHMAGMSGIECVKQLKTMMPQMQIMMLTVYEDTEQIFQALSSGASGYMLKRSTPGKLLDAIADVHEGGSPMSGPIARKVVASFQRNKPKEGEQPHFTSREQSVLDCLANGLTYKQTADQLSISIPTIRSYLRRIYEKLHVQSRTEAVAKYMQHQEN
ncbi:MAG TPA: response regulator transcription factor [Pseudomonadales bacterium]|nr:response regulator transcription factor [Pseudomonadales bacterium]